MSREHYTTQSAVQWEQEQAHDKENCNKAQHTLALISCVIDDICC